MYKFDESVNKILSQLLIENAQNEAPKLADKKPEGMTDEDWEYIKQQFEAAKNGDSGLTFEKIKNGVIDTIKSFFGKTVNQATGLPIANTEKTQDQKDLTAKLAAAAEAFEKNGGAAVTGVTVDLGSALVSSILPPEMIEFAKKNRFEWWWKLPSLFEPTGVMSWVYLDEAKAQYEQHKDDEDSDIYALNYLAAYLSCFPIGKIVGPVLKAPFWLLGMGLKWPARALTGGLTKTLGLETFAVKGTNIAIKGIAKPVTIGARAGIRAHSQDIETPEDKKNSEVFSKEWEKKGEEMLKQIKPPKPRVGTGWNVPETGQSTQSF